MKSKVILLTAIIALTGFFASNASAQTFIHVPLYNTDIGSCVDTIYVTAVGAGANELTTAIPSSFPTSGADRTVTMFFGESYSVEQLLLLCNWDVNTNTFLTNNDISSNSPIPLPFTSQVFELPNTSTTTATTTTEIIGIQHIITALEGIMVVLSIILSIMIATLILSRVSNKKS